MSDFLYLIKLLYFILGIFWGILKTWWWLFLPFILLSPLKFFYLWYIRVRWDNTVKKVILEIKIPKEVERPFKAMEQVFSNLWTLYDPPNWSEKWLEGHFLLAFSLEIVSIGGNVHFFVRIPESSRKMLETSIYSQFPEVEISEASDYTENIPEDIPNEKWDMYGWDFINVRNSAYPIKTYSKFFEERQEMIEEKRISPLAVLIEGMAALKKEEQLWLQIRAVPILNEVPWVKEAKNIVNKLVNRPGPASSKSIVGEAARAIAFGKHPFLEEKKEQQIIPPEMRLTPGEREVVSAIENKISKQAFIVNIRTIYLGHKDVFSKTRMKIPLTYSAGISTGNLQGLKPWKVTIPKVVPPAFFRQKRIYLKKRNLIRRYRWRVGPLFPSDGGTYILNTEELATLYHFPGRTAAPSPSLERIETKKSAAPIIPTEE